MRKTLLAAPILLAAAMALTLTLTPKSGDMPDNARAAVVDDLKGTVKATQNGNELAAFKGLALLRENELGTGGESWSRLELDEGRFAIVEENTRILIAALADNLTDAKTTRVYMSGGKAWFDVSKELSEGEGFEVKTPFCALGVRGTLFSVAAGKNETTLVVYKGEVSLRAEREDGTALADSAGNMVSVVVSAGKAKISVESGIVSLTQGGLTLEDLAPLMEDGEAGPGGVYASMREHNPEHVLSDEEVRQGPSGTVQRSDVF